MKSDAQFVKDLEYSQVAVRKVHRFLREVWGWNAHMMPVRVRPTVQDRWNYVDRGDIAVLEPGQTFQPVMLQNGHGIVEVKHKKQVEFRSIADFKYPTVMLDEVYKVEKHDPYSFLGYALLNRSMTHMLWADAMTMPHWTQDTVFDSGANGERRYFYCPKRLCQCYALNEHRPF